MSSHAPPARRRRRMSDAVLVIAVLALVVLAQVATQLFNGLELKLYDVASTRTARQPSDRIAISAISAIDDNSIASIRRWPWPREAHAQPIDQLKQAGAKTIADTAFFFEPQTDRRLSSPRVLRDQVHATPTAPGLGDLGPGARAHLLGFNGPAEDTRDSGKQLAQSIERSGRVILPPLFTLGEPQGLPDQPLHALGAAALAVAHLDPSVDTDGAVRDEALLVRFDGVAVPSMALALAAHSLNQPPSDLQVLPQYYPDRDGQHPFNADTVHDAGEEHGLVTHARTGHLQPVATVLLIGERVAKALDNTHRHRVVHRDIKPGNIMYDPETDAVKVTDFGIACTTDASRTKTGMVFGTPSSMSPEQLAGQRVDGRADIHALGVTLHQLPTRSQPSLDRFAGRTDAPNRQ